jgi:transposase InsO family protein
VNRYRFIEAEKPQQGTLKRASCAAGGLLCRRLRPPHRYPSARQRTDEQLTERIRQAHQAAKGRYGAPPIQAELRRRGHRQARKRVARRMRAAGLCGRTPRRSKRTTIPDPAAAARVELVRRDFGVNAAAVNTRWCGDITYLWTWDGWLYLATVIDIASRRVVGFALAEHLPTSLVADALTNAVAARDPAPGWSSMPTAVPGHQRRRRHLAADLAVILSSGHTGQCWDNALAESFFASLKGECLDQQPWPTRAAARGATVDYIAWDNGTRLHSALG